MNIVWDREKNTRLIRTRGVSFEEVARLIMEKKYTAILENPARPDQMIFILPYKEYTHVVPFVFDGDDRIVLKTIFPSRKFHKMFEGKDSQ
jgi:uncharacterized DUF497 family protein